MLDESRLYVLGRVTTSTKSRKTRRDDPDLAQNAPLVERPLPPPLPFPATALQYRFAFGTIAGNCGTPPLCCAHLGETCARHRRFS
jgi:hypothetical protein